MAAQRPPRGRLQRGRPVGDPAGPGVERGGDDQPHPRPGRDPRRLGDDALGRAAGEDHAGHGRQPAQVAAPGGPARRRAGPGRRRGRRTRPRCCRRRRAGTAARGGRAPGPHPAGSIRAAGRPRARSASRSRTAARRSASLHGGRGPIAAIRRAISVGSLIGGTVRARGDGAGAEAVSSRSHGRRRSRVRRPRAPGRARRLGRGEPVGARRASLERIARVDPRLNAFASCSPTARAPKPAGRGAPRRRRPRPLLGVPVAVKDDMDVAGEVTRPGDGRQRRPAQADSEIVRRLREAGAIIIGKTNVPELDDWPFTETATWGVTRNPWDLAADARRVERRQRVGGRRRARARPRGVRRARLDPHPRGLQRPVRPQAAVGRVPTAPKGDDAWHGTSTAGRSRDRSATAPCSSTRWPTGRRGAPSPRPPAGRPGGCASRCRPRCRRP